MPGTFYSTNNIMLAVSISYYTGTAGKLLGLIESGP